MKEVKELYQTHTHKEISKTLGIPRGSIAKKLGLKKDNPRIWTKKEEKILLKNYKYGISYTLSLLPNRTKWGIVNKYRELTGKRNNG